MERGPFFNSGPRQPDAFDQFNATELFCPKCKRANPVQERLLLVLPQGDKYEYLCRVCRTPVGSKIAGPSGGLTI